VNNGEIVLEHCRTQEQVADILTKPLDQKSFEFLRKCLGMTECPAVEIKGECWNVNSNCKLQVAGEPEQRRTSSQQRSGLAVFRRQENFGTVCRRGDIPARGSDELWRGHVAPA